MIERGKAQGRSVMQIVRVGLDLAKHVFEVHAVGAGDRVVLRKTLRRDAVAQFFSELPACVVGMEACSGAHYWAKVLTDLGHEVRLIAPQFVKPYVKSNKNDRNDAEAICEAVGRPSMRFVPVKSSEQLAIQAVHRIRQRLVGDRTRLANQIRGLLAEHGVVIARDIRRLRHALVQIVEGSEPGLNELLRDLVGELKTELAELDRRLAVYNRRIRDLFRSTEMCQRIGKIEGIGPSHRDGTGCRCRRQDLLQEWPSVRGLAGAGSTTTVKWRQSPAVRHQQAG